jgi:thioredoxin reductase (NADPH)
MVVEAKACLLTGGIGSFSPRPMPAGAGWEGRGLVYFVPRLEAHRDQDVVIVGGGDSAFDWASMLHPVARSIRIVHRREQFRAHGSMIDHVRDLGVALHTPCEVTAVNGGDRIESVAITSKTTGATETVPADAVIAALGFVANIGPMAHWGLDLDKRHVKVGTTMATSLPRIFAAGDLAVYPGKVALISVGFGEAAIAVNNAAPIIDPAMGIFPGHSSGESN